jgi:hypothetical protein
MGERMSLKEAGLLWVASMVAIMVAHGFYDDAKTVAYWRGRKDGWDMHRRMIENKIDANDN